MTSRQLVLTLIILVGLGIVFTAARLLLIKPADVMPSPSESPVYCTMEAKMCSDGSYVGRIPPNCDFAECPAPTSSPSTTPLSSTFTLALGQKGGTSDIGITPLNVTQDSRCPAGVYCIQAGTVDLRIELAAQNLNTTDQVITLNKPLTVGSRTITLTEVAPLKTANTTIKAADYRFTFIVK